MKLSYTVLLAGLLLISTVLFAKTIIEISNSDTTHLSTSAVKDIVTNLHKGRVISIERREKRHFPNCHIVKMVSPTGVFKYIRYACK